MPVDFAQWSYLLFHFNTKASTKFQMAEFTHIGKHCEHTNCRQVDFLPFKCDGCKKNLCLDHRTYKDHQCPVGDTKNKVVNTCPLCEHPITLKEGNEWYNYVFNFELGEDLNSVVEKHILGGWKDQQKERIN